MLECPWENAFLNAQLVKTFHQEAGKGSRLRPEFLSGSQEASFYFSYQQPVGTSGEQLTVSWTIQMWLSEEERSGLSDAGAFLCPNPCLFSIPFFQKTPATSNKGVNFLFILLPPLS